LIQKNSSKEKKVIQEEGAKSDLVYQKKKSNLLNSPLPLMNRKAANNGQEKEQKHREREKKD